MGAPGFSTFTRAKVGSTSATVSWRRSFLHEGGHISLDLAHVNSAGWRAAQEADGVFISDYARDFPEGEDIAESILPYFAVRYRPERLTEADRSAILAAIPNRLVYFDEQDSTCRPIVRGDRRRASSK